MMVTVQKAKGELMGILKNEIMRVYDVRPTTSERLMLLLELADRIAKEEYERGRIDCQRQIGHCRNCKHSNKYFQCEHVMWHNGPEDYCSKWEGKDGT